MMRKTLNPKETSMNTLDLQRKQLLGYFSITTILLFLNSFLLSSPKEIFEGMKLIFVSRDALITDYFELTSYGTAFFNSALLMLMGLLTVIRLNLHFTGLTVAALFINAGFALFGKNPVNILSILLGTYLYAKVNRVTFKRYVYTAMFGTCLGPIITELVHVLPFDNYINIIIAILLGILIGFILPPLAMHTVSMHNGYSLFNVGFAAGLIGFVFVSMFNSFGYTANTLMIWKKGQPLWLAVGLYAFFILTFLYGLYINKGKLKPLLRLLEHPGRAVADFILMDGVGTTLMNMGIVGAFSTTYILLIQGDLSGPVVGGILTIFGFAAFGIHLRNYWPILLGVFLTSFVTIYPVTSASMQLAAIFCAGLAPIAGQFGILAGIMAGFLHVGLVHATGSMYAGLNLYNNGFATGFVAIIMIPLLESYIKHFNDIKEKK